MALLPSISSPFLCLLLHLLHLFSVTVVAQLPYDICGNGGNFTANSTYESNLNLLLSTLASDASAFGGFSKNILGKTPDQVYGLVLCRGDVNASECRSCLEAANHDILQTCPNSKTVMIWYDTCFLRFSNEMKFLSFTDNTQQLLLGNTAYFTQILAGTGNNVSSLTQFHPYYFDQVVNFLLNRTTNWAVASTNSTRMFATGVVITNYTSELFNGTIYGLVQCTPDLSPPQCRQCLEGQWNPMPTFLVGKIGGRVLGDRCSFRYEVYSFFEGAPSLNLTAPILNLTAPSPNHTAPPGPVLPADAGARRLSILGIGLISGASGLLVIIATVVVSWRILKEKNVRKRKQRFYRQNLDLLKREQSCFSEVALVERMKIYELDELEKATNNFDKSRIVGGGGHGQVYKGILSDQRVVAIKKPKITDQAELGQFINEVFILSQTSHRNVVRFYGCCLETEVPLLVFEFISGGTLIDHLLSSEAPLSFEDRLRIATEVIKALSYLHTEASVTIFHRDIKSSNILLDGKNTVRLADFGASRSLALEQTSITTAVQGTLGYLDPEYHVTGRLTEKSDVYSFGIILVELLSGRITSKHLIRSFQDSLKENSLENILDPLILKTGNIKIAKRLARLAERCLELKGKERPTMKEVEDNLEALMRSKEQKGDHRYHDTDAENTDRRITKQYSFEKQLDAMKKSILVMVIMQIIENNLGAQ